MKSSECRVSGGGVNGGMLSDQRLLSVAVNKKRGRKSQLLGHIKLPGCPESEIGGPFCDDED